MPSYQQLLDDALVFGGKHYGITGLYHRGFSQRLKCLSEIAGLMMSVSVQRWQQGLGLPLSIGKSTHWSAGWQMGAGPGVRNPTWQP